jgi:ABC-2 type transport system ATP-binding protein
MLTVENLVKKFKDKTAVDNITFSAEPGKIFGLLGPNGAGKTTTIRTVLNIIKPTSGKILFNNEPIRQNFLDNVGYLPEERGLYKKSKVVDIILYFSELKGLSRSVASQKAKEWLEKLNVTTYSNKKLEELSKGNQQKIQFIIAVIHDPKLLILDEPFSGFDPINQQEIKEFILSFISSGKIIILSTHQMDTVEKLCQEILLIDNGKEICKGTLSEIKRNFGGNNIKLEFTGNQKVVWDMPEVVSHDSYGNYAEIQLKEDVNPTEFLRKILPDISIKNFSVIEPTLNKIFIDLVKQNSGRK